MNRWLQYLGAYAFIGTLYLATNHQTLHPAIFLPMSALDQSVPFIPWTSWIYSTIYVFPFCAAYFISKEEDVKAALIAFIGLGVLCCSIFMFYPTMYPRPVLEESGIGALPLKLVHLIDSPANCFPSGHVAFSFMSAFFIARYNRVWGNMAILWAMIVSFTTLTTKQHYVWDIVSGYVAARVVYKIVEILFFEDSRENVKN